MQFTYTKNSPKGTEAFGFGASPLRRRQSRKSVQQVMEMPPSTRRSQTINFASFGPAAENQDYPIVTETESQAFLSTQRTQRAATEPLAEIKEMLESKDEGNLYSLEDGRETKMEFQKLQVIECGVTLVAIISAFLTVITYDLEFDGEKSDLVIILLWSILASNLVCILLTVLRYLQNLKFRKARNLILQKATLASTGDIWYLIAEIVIFLIQPYPFLHDIKVVENDTFGLAPYYYNVNDFFYLLLILRVYILGRFILNNLMYRSPRSHRVGDMYGADSGYIYACRSVMKVDSAKVVVLLLGGSIMVFGYMIRVCERPYSRISDNDIDFDTYWNSMWCIILTMTTVGYGDVYARTMIGRAVSLMVCIWGTFVVSIMVVTLTNILTMNSAEEKSLMVLRRLEARKRQKKEAAYIVTNIAKIALVRKKKMNRDQKNDETREVVRDLKRHLNTFRRTCREIKGLDDSVGAAEEVNRQIRFVGEDVQTLIENQKELQKTVSDYIAGLSPRGGNRYPGSLYVIPESKANFKGVDEDAVIHTPR